MGMPVMRTWGVLALWAGVVDRERVCCLLWRRGAPDEDGDEVFDGQAIEAVDGWRRVGVALGARERLDMRRVRPACLAGRRASIVASECEVRCEICVGAIISACLVRRWRIGTAMLCAIRAGWIEDAG